MMDARGFMAASGVGDNGVLGERGERGDRGEGPSVGVLTSGPAF